MLINNHNPVNLNTLLIEDYKKSTKSDLNGVEFELIDKSSLQGMECPSKIQQIGNKILQTGSMLDYITLIPGVDAYLDPYKLNSVASVCKLPFQISDIKETVKENSNNNQLIKTAKLTMNACKILATTACLSQSLLPVATGFTITAGIGYLTTTSDILSYGLTAYDMYNKYTSPKIVQK